MALVTLVGVGLMAAPPRASAQLDPSGADPSQPSRITRGPDGRVHLARGLSLATHGDTYVERARDFIRAHGSDYDLADLEFEMDDVRQASGLTVVVLGRRVRGEPVYRSRVRIRLDGRGIVDLVVSTPGPRAVSDGVRRVSDADVARRAESLVPFPRGRAYVTRAYVDIFGVLHRGFVVEVDGERVTERAELVFDGDGRPVAAGSRTVHALGRVFVTNPVVAMDATSDVELLNLMSTDRLTGRYIRALACPATGRCIPTQHALADAAGDFLFEPADPDYGDEFSEVSAYYHSDRIAAYFRDTHDFIWDCCDASTVLDVVANYTESPGRPYNNAAYSPSSCSRSECGTIILGQGPLRDYAYDGDVVYHEYTHAVVDALANIAGFDYDHLGISYEPSAINEGTADYFSATLAGDPTVAEYFSGSGALGTSGALRDLDNTFRCPNDLFGEGHQDGRIWGATGWSLRESLGREKADALIYGTLAMMVDNTDFDEAGQLLVATAEAFEGTGVLTPADAGRVMEEVLARGLLGCQRIVPLDDGAEHLGYSGTGFATGTIGGQVAPTHYAIDIPADATRLTLNVTAATATGEYTAFFRDGESLRFIGTRLVHDAEVPVDGDLVLGRGDPHPLPRCQTLYIALRADDLVDRGESVYSIRATLERSGNPDAPCPEPLGADAGTDAGVGDGGGDTAVPDARSDAGPTETLGGGGCRCDASGAPKRPPWLFGLVVALAFTTRLYVPGRSWMSSRRSAPSK
jgi:hypothetical protein